MNLPSESYLEVKNSVLTPLLYVIPTACDNKGEETPTDDKTSD